MLSSAGNQVYPMFKSTRTYLKGPHTQHGAEGSGEMRGAVHSTSDNTFL